MEENKLKMIRKYVSCQDFQNKYIPVNSTYITLDMLTAKEIENHIKICDKCLDFKIKKDNKALEYLKVKCNNNFKAD